MKQIIGEPKDGDTVFVRSYNDQPLAVGHYNNGSIIVRILSFQKTEINDNFWMQRIEAAWQKRFAIADLQASNTNCFRLIHAEGDQLPGLIVDIYGDVAVMQCHSIGMHKNRQAIAQAIFNTSNDGITAVYDKSVEVLPKPYRFNFKNTYLIGEREVPETIVVENGNGFHINWETGQKTGFSSTKETIENY